MEKSFTYKMIEDGGNRKVLFLNSSGKEITKHFIRKNDVGKECFDIINPYINYDNLENIKKSEIEMGGDNIGDCIQSVIDGYGDKMIIRELSPNSFSAPNSYVASVVKYLDEDYGKKEREEIVDEYKNIEWKYSIKLVPQYNNFYSYVLQKDGLNYITNLVDEGYKAITFDTAEEAQAYIDNYFGELVYMHTGNILSAFKKSRRSTILAENDPDNILKIALRHSDMTGTQLEQKYEIKVFQVMV